MHTVLRLLPAFGRTTRLPVLLLRALAPLQALVVALLVVASSGCESSTHPPGLEGGDGRQPGGTKSTASACDTPKTGCGCDEVGEFAPCGDVSVRSDDYVTCSMGQRECKYNHVWGACVGDHLTTKYDSQSLTEPLATTGPAKCVGNPCDPYCNYSVSDATGLTDLPSGLCSTPAGGLVACGPQCGYSGVHAAGYASLPTAFKKQPTTCMTTADTCGYDTNCTAAGVCSDWTFPCYEPTWPGCAAAKKIDLELGPPCGTGVLYHFPVCNRGAERADTGTIKIGVYSSSTPLQTTVSGASPGAPTSGSLTFTLGTSAGKYIDPGTCLDVNISNSTPSASLAAGLIGTRAVALNYDASLAECNYANNWHVYDATLACQGCVGLECAQTCPSANLTGTIWDPGGVNPLPGVVVYVPNAPVAPLVDGVACDTCATLYSGSPIASAVTGYDGKFTLTNVPVATAFNLVVQTGRWRRVVPISAIVGVCGAGTPTAALPNGAAANGAAGDTARLPSKASEGNIPKIALSMSAGDHLECLLRKIGIEDSEFTAPSGAGRIHLYAFNGMTFPGTTCTAPTSGTCANDLWSSPSKLDTYSAVIAPCDKNPFGGTPSAANPYTPYGSTALTNPLNTMYPPYPTAPDSGNPTGPESPTAAEQNNLKAYVDKGGRLFATHWMAYFLTVATYPAAVNYVYGDYVDKDRQAPNFPYTIDQASTVGKSMADWLASTTVTFTNWRHLALSVNAPAVRLAYGNSTAAPVSHAAGSSTGWGGPMVSAFQFDAPWGVPAASQCGRIVVAESHVSKSTSTTSQQTPFLPTASTTCDPAAMTGEEKAFEFLLFSATQCVGLVAPPAPVASLLPTTYFMDYQATCPSGTKPEWQFFSWKATIPVGTTIVFTGATASTQAGLPAATPVNIGTAGSTATIWTSDPKTVDWRLENATPPQGSRSWLRVGITVNPTATTTPLLSNWQQVFDCLPAE